MKKLLYILLIGLILTWGGYLYAGAAKTQSWNASYETIPGDNDNISEGAQRIRNLKRDIRERIGEDHYMDLAGTQADQGEHKKITFQAPQTVDPTNVANKGFLYTKDVSSKAELFWEDESGNVKQLTSGGNISYAFPSGTAMFFYQDSCPTGWSQSASNDYLLILTKGTANGGEAGGTIKSSSTWTQPGHTHTGPALHRHGPGSLSYTLTIPRDGWTGSSGTPAGRLGYSTGTENGDTGLTSSRNLTTSSPSGYTDYNADAGVTGSGATANTWRPLSINVILCTKN